MSLNFSYNKVRDWEAASTHPVYEEEWHPIGNALVWISLVCGFNEITEKNAGEVADRLMEWQAVKGPMVEYTMPDGSHRKLYIDEPEVRRYIGLTTNASTMTKTQWNTHLLSIIRGEVSDTRWRRREKASALQQFDADCTVLNEKKGEKV